MFAAATEAAKRIAWRGVNSVFDQRLPVGRMQVLRATLIKSVAASAQEVQLDFSDAGCDADTGLSIARQFDQRRRSRPPSFAIRARLHSAAPAPAR
jgi:hypothetical protein